MNVSILVFDACTALPSVGSLELLMKSGALMGDALGRDVDAPFDVQLVSLGDRFVDSAQGFSVPCHATIAEVGRSDLVIVPALDGDPLATLRSVKACIPWIRAMYEGGADVASICTGAFVLAETGLLDGRQATTHWIAQRSFAEHYPRVELLPHSIIVDEGRIITCGGATSFMNLIMYLVEKYCGRETAWLASRMFLIDLNKGPQTSYAIFSTQKSHGDDLVLRAQKLIEDEADQVHSVAELADRLAASRRNLERRFKQATGNTILQYLQRLRVERAKKHLETTGLSLPDIVRAVGYDDVPSFRRLFSRITGMSPSRYRQRYAREARASG